jgi:hypothetical protein
MSYEEWYKWQRKVIREEVLESLGEKGNNSPIYSITEMKGEQKENGEQ